MHELFMNIASFSNNSLIVNRAVFIISLLRNWAEGCIQLFPSSPRGNVQGKLSRSEAANMLYIQLKLALYHSFHITKGCLGKPFLKAN